MSAPRIYCDIDDVLSRTIEGLIDLLEREHGRRVPVEAVSDFSLTPMFGLAEDELSDFIDLSHTAEILALLEPVPGGADVLGRLYDRGCQVTIVTGRPPAAAPASREWLARHGIAHHELFFANKYDRPAPDAHDARFLPLSEVMAMEFEWAVEDSLEMAVRLAGEGGMCVALMDRPWNRDLDAVPGAVAERIVRCHSWVEIESALLS
jgi:uncharacterized HAD superfamily protein